MDYALGTWNVKTLNKPGAINRWTDKVEKDAKKLMGVKNWKRAAQKREERRGLIRGAKAQYRAVAP
jgi:hypothetical protein